MAQAAKGGNVAADMKPTDYRGAVNRMKAIKAKSDKQKAIAGEIGDIYSKCEGLHGVNKMAAKMFYALSKLEAPDRMLVFRDLNGLLDAAGYETEDADLVDQSQGNVVSMRFKDPETENESVGAVDVDDEIEALADDGEQLPPDDDFEEASEEELAQQTGRAETAAKRRAAEAIGKGDPEPYTGDNSDLADAAE